MEGAVKNYIIGFLSFWGILGIATFGISRLSPETCNALFPYGLGLLAVLWFSSLCYVLGSLIRDAI
jgi:hypothetical protein